MARRESTAQGACPTHFDHRSCLFWRDLPQSLPGKLVPRMHMPAGCSGLQVVEHRACIHLPSRARHTRRQHATYGRTRPTDASGAGQSGPARGAPIARAVSGASMCRQARSATVTAIIRSVTAIPSTAATIPSTAATIARLPDEQPLTSALVQPIHSRSSADHPHAHPASARKLRPRALRS